MSQIWLMDHSLRTPGLKGQIMELPWWLNGKDLPANARDTGLIPDPRKSHMLRSNLAWAPQLLSLCSRVQNPSYWAQVLLLLEKAMAPHSSTLAWKIPWTEEPGRLQSMGSQRVRHDWATSLSLFPFMQWRRKWQPTPVFLPGESQGRGSLVGRRLWGRTESDTTEAT